MASNRWTTALLFSISAAVLAACAGSHQANPVPGYAAQSDARTGSRNATTNAAASSMCSIYSGFGALSFCYDFDETSGTTLVDESGAGHNGTIASSGVTYRAAGIASNSSAAETTDGSTGSATSGFTPGTGSFSVSFFVDLKSNASNYARLAATGDPKNSSNHSGWYVTVSPGSTNPVYVDMGTGSGTGTSFGFIPLALNTPANVTLTYNATSNLGTLCVATNATPTCATQTLAASHVPSGNPIVFGGAPKYYPANATFDEAAFYAGTVLTSAQIATIASYAGSGTSATPTPKPSVAPTTAGSGMCSTYAGFGSPAFCYDFDEASGKTLLDDSGNGNNGTITSSGVTYRAAGIATNSGAAETTDGSSGSMTGGYVPTSGSFSLSFFVNLKSNANNYARLAVTGDPKNSSNHSGWYIIVNSGSTNPIYAAMGTGSGSGTSFGFIPLALNTPANVTLTYDATSKLGTLCVATNSSPTCNSQTLPAAYVPSGNAIVFGGAPTYYPANATFDEAAYYQGTVLSSSQIATLGGYAGTGTGSTPTPVASPSSGPTVAPTARPTTAPSASPTKTPTPAPSSSSGFNDFMTYGYDSARDMYNPNSTAFSPKSIAGTGLHLAWQVGLGGGNQSQPLVLTNVAGHAALLVVVSKNTISAYDGVTGSKVWGPTTLGIQNLQNCGTGGIAGTPIYDAAIPALIVAAGNGNNPNHVIVSQLNVTTGSVIKSADVTPTLLTNEQTSAHNGMLFNNGMIYIGTGSNCESASWRGRVLEIDPGSLAVNGTFFTTYGHGGNYGGGGIWAWGGVSGDSSGNIYVASGNAETPNATLSGTPAPPFIGTTDEQAGYAEHIAKVTSNLTTVEDSNYPGFNFNEGYADLDFTGTPILFQPNGCNQLSGTQGKGGTMVVHDTTNLSTFTSYTLSEPSGAADYIGNPGYSPATQLLYAAVASSQGGSLEPPGMVALQFSCPGGSSSILWHTAFGPDSFSYSGTTPRSAPAATAGGVVFMGTPCTASGSGCGTPSGTPSGALWALDASTGSVLGGGNPILLTPDMIRMAPTIDGEWMWVLDNSGNLYGMTVDPSVKSISARRLNRMVPTARYPNL